MAAISEITLSEVKDYLGVTATDSDVLIAQQMAAAKAYICSYTGLTPEQADSHADLAVVFYMLVDTYFNSGVYSGDKAQENRAISAILNMHATNYVGNSL